MRHQHIIDAWQGRPTFAVIDLDAYATNVTTMRQAIGPGTRLCTVVKANGYGHGAIPVAKVAVECGVDYLAVATVDEGVELREAGIDAPLLVMGPINASEIETALHHAMTLVIVDPAFAAAVNGSAARLGRRARVHLKIDTGMRRFGCAPEQVVSVGQTIVALPHLEFEGVMTHIASADVAGNDTPHDQVATFDRCVADLQAAGIQPPLQHVANSATTYQFVPYRRSMVRTGLSTYGVPPAAHVPLMAGMRQVMTVYSRVARDIPLSPGDRVGYGGTWQADTECQGALVSIGYADGYLRSLSSRGWMAIDGARAEVIGRVCMDQTILRAPEGSGRNTGKYAVVIGDGTDGTPGAPDLDDVAIAAGSIPHELMTGLAPRVPKLYVRHGTLQAVADLHGYRRV